MKTGELAGLGTKNWRIDEKSNYKQSLDPEDPEESWKTIVWNLLRPRTTKKIVNFGSLCVWIWKINETLAAGMNIYPWNIYQKKLLSNRSNVMLNLTEQALEGRPQQVLSLHWPRFIIFMNIFYQVWKLSVICIYTDGIIWNTWIYPYTQCGIHPGMLWIIMYVLKKLVQEFQRPQQETRRV